MAFQIWHRHFKYQVIFFGFSNNMVIFQRYVNKSLVEKLNIFIIIYLDDILIYKKDPGQSHLKAIRKILDQLRKYLFFTNLKKCCFPQDKICFLKYMIFSKSINIEAKKIEVRKNLPKLNLVCNI